MMDVLKMMMVNVIMMDVLMDGDSGDELVNVVMCV